MNIQNNEVNSETVDEQKNKSKKKEKKKEKKKDDKREKAEKTEGERSSGEDLEQNYAVVPPNGGWGWVVVAAAFYCSLVTDGIQLTFGVFLKNISESLSEDHSTIALAGALMFGFHLFVGPICAGLSNVFGIRLVTISGSIVCAIGVGITYWAKSIWHLFLTYGVIGGTGLGFVYMNCMVVTNEYFTTLLPIAIGIVVCGTGCGTMVFAALGNFLLKFTTWQNSFLLQAALAGSMALAAITFKPLKPIPIRLEGVPTRSPQSMSSSTDKDVVYIKKNVSYSTAGSRLSLLNAAYGDLVEKTVVSDIKRSRLKKGSCCRNCGKRKKKSLDVLVLSEVKTNDSTTSRKPFMEKKQSSDVDLMSVKTVFTQVEFNKKPEKWEPIKRTIKAIIDCHLLASVAFTIFTVSGGLQMAALLVVFTFEKDRCTELGFTEEMSVYFVMCLGGSNMFWRLIMGGLATLPKVNTDALSIAGSLIGGAATLCSGFNSDIWYQFVFCFLFGMATASFAVFRVIFLVELVGPNLVGNAIGIGVLFMGVFCVIAPPLFGLAMEITESYEIIFFSTGILLIATGLSQIGLRKMRRKELERENRKKNRN